MCTFGVCLFFFFLSKCKTLLFSTPNFIVVFQPQQLLRRMVFRSQKSPASWDGDVVPVGKYGSRILKQRVSQLCYPGPDISSFLACKNAGTELQADRFGQEWVAHYVSFLIFLRFGARLIFHPEAEMSWLKLLSSWKHKLILHCWKTRKTPRKRVLALKMKRPKRGKTRQCKVGILFLSCGGQSGCYHLLLGELALHTKLPSEAYCWFFLASKFQKLG